MTKSHVYQFALRRADDKEKKFIIESDLVYTDIKLTQEEVDTIAVKHECDIKVTYLGVLVPTKKEEVLEAQYHTDEMIEKNLLNWREEDGLKEQSI